MPTICLLPTVLCYGIATLLAWIDGWRFLPPIRRIAFWVFLLGLGLHTVYLLFALFPDGTFALTQRYQAVTLLAWTCAVAYAVLSRNTRWQYLGILFFPLLFLLLGQVFLGTPTMRIVLRSHEAVLLPFHLFFAMVALAVFLLSTLSGSLLLWSESRLKSRRPGTVALRMPGLPMIERALARLLFIGFAVLTITLATGVGLRLDGMESLTGHRWWALGAWVIYGVVLQARMVRGWGRWWLPLSFVGFAVIILSFLEVHNL